MGVSVVVLTKNEENNIVDALASVEWADEVIVIDDMSEDNTTALAKKQDVKVYSHASENNFAYQRNFALSKASQEWVLFLDADERVSPVLAKEIQSVIQTDSNGFYVKREDTIWGKRLQHGETGSTWLLRLGRKDSGKWQGSVHEKWRVHGPTSKLHEPLLHYPHPTVSTFLEKVNFYSTLRAEELYAKKITVSWLSIIVYPKTKFIFNYFIKQGYKDGTAGLVVAMMMSFHSFLVRGKLWQLWHKN